MSVENTTKTLEAFSYIVKKVEKKNFYNVLKVFYLADKLHMEKYGRFVFNDTYIAMNRGPVPSHAYDLVKFVRDGEALPFDLKPSFRIGANYKIIVLREPELDHFSKSDLECIDEVIELGKTKDLATISHDKAWNKTDRNRAMSDNAIISTLKDSKALLDLHNNRHV